jgi:TPR repeat protein
MNIRGVLWRALFVFLLVISAVRIVHRMVREDHEDFAVKLKDAKDLETAIRILRPVAEQGNAAAQNELGRRLGTFARDRFHGKPPPRGWEERDPVYVEATQWLMKAANQGYLPAELELGFSYALGDGVEKDDGEAIRWWREAAEHGDSEAAVNLGDSYYYGHHVGENPVEGVKWWRKAAEEGNFLGLTGLGHAYQDGKGVPQDFTAAYAWFSLAAARDLSPSLPARERDDLAAQMTREQVAEGQRMAREWKPK